MTIPACHNRPELTAYLRVEWRYAQRKGAQKAVEVEMGVVE